MAQTYSRINYHMTQTLSSDLAALKLAIENSEATCGNTRIVTIDGPAGSGKTTLAKELAGYLGDARVVHLDELYEGWSKALDDILYQRIHSWIITPIRNGLPAKHLSYNWTNDNYSNWTEIPITRVLIIEGVGSGHTSLRPYVSQSVWIEADEELLLDRVVQRDGEIVRDEMLIWKAKERAYFEVHQVKKSANFHLFGQ